MSANTLFLRLEGPCRHGAIRNRSLSSGGRLKLRPNQE